jgi:hypothetical protein
MAYRMIIPGVLPGNLQTGASLKRALQHRENSPTSLLPGNGSRSGIAEILLGGFKEVESVDPPVNKFGETKHQSLLSIRCYDG